MVWANHLQVTQRITRQAALSKAVDRVFGKPGQPQDQRGARAGETEQQRVLRERREAAVMRGASASRQQPPPMDLGATPQGPAKLDPTKYSNDEWDKLSVDENEKRRARGDFIYGNGPDCNSGLGLRAGFPPPRPARRPFFSHKRGAPPGLATLDKQPGESRSPCTTARASRCRKHPFPHLGSDIPGKRGPHVAAWFHLPFS